MNAEDEEYNTTEKEFIITIRTVKMPEQCADDMLGAIRQQQRSLIATSRVCEAAYQKRGD